MKIAVTGIIEKIIDIENNSIFNTLIVSPPGIGKTTLLKDLIKKISNGFECENNIFKGLQVTVIDERGEIAASYKGISQNNLGIRTDVFCDIPKHIGMIMAIRSMNPKVIVADEIGSTEDVDAIKQAMCCGVKGIFTAHGKNIDDIKNNENINKLFNCKIFEKIIILQGRNGSKFLYSGI